MGKTDKSLDLRGFQKLTVVCGKGETLTFTQEEGYVLFTRNCHGMGYVTINNVSWLKDVNITAMVTRCYGEPSYGQPFNFCFVEHVGWEVVPPPPGRCKYGFKNRRIFAQTEQYYTTTTPVEKVIFE